MTRLMAPYDVERSAPARKEYAPHDELDYLLEIYESYGLRREDVDAVVAALPEDTDVVCGHDAGRFWRMATDNSWSTTTPLPERLDPPTSLHPMGLGTI